MTITASGAVAQRLPWTASGNVWAWGNNNDGQLGDGNGGAGVVQTTPVQITKPPKMANAIVVAAGYDHYRGPFAATGPSGPGETTVTVSWAMETAGAGVIQKKPIKVPGLTNIMHVAAGYKSTIARRKDGTIWAWGNNSNGQLGERYDNRPDQSDKKSSNLYPGCKGRAERQSAGPSPIFLSIVHSGTRHLRRRHIFPKPGDTGRHPPRI